MIKLKLALSMQSLGIRALVVISGLSLTGLSFGGQSYDPYKNAEADVEAPVTNAPSADAKGLAGMLDLPSDWKLSPVNEGYECGSNSGGAQRGENSYSESSSKFLTWLTGDVELAEYEPIGEVANYFGFAAARTDIRERTDSLGDERFRGSVYAEMLELLDDEQRAHLYELVELQMPMLHGFLDDRVLLINELWAQKEGKSIDFDLVTKLMTSVGKYEGLITVTGAQAYAELMPMLTQDQMQYIQDIRAGKISADQMRNTDQPYAAKAKSEFNAMSDVEQEIMQTIASKVFSWATSDLDDAIYLPPGKIANFFGFANYRYVDRAEVSRGGAAQLVHENLNEEQRKLMCDLSWVVVDFTDQYIDGRAELIKEVWKLHDADIDLDVDGLAEQYAMVAGVGEGRRGTVEAMTFNLIASMLSEEQIAKFESVRVQSTGESARNADRSGNAERTGEGGNRQGGSNRGGGQNREGGGNNREGGQNREGGGGNRNGETE